MFLLYFWVSYNSFFLFSSFLFSFFLFSSLFFSSISLSLFCFHPFSFRLYSFLLFLFLFCFHLFSFRVFLFICSVFIISLNGLWWATFFFFKCWHTQVLLSLFVTFTSHISILSNEWALYIANRAVNFFMFFRWSSSVLWDLNSEFSFQLEVWATATFDSIACWSVSIIAYLTCLLWIGLACPVHAYTDLRYKYITQPPRRSNSRSYDDVFCVWRHTKNRGCAHAQ